MTPRLDERLLGDVLRRGAIVEHTIGDREHEPTEASDQLTDCILVAFAQRHCQGGVRLDHVRWSELVHQPIQRRRGRTPRGPRSSNRARRSSGRLHSRSRFRAARPDLGPRSAQPGVALGPNGSGQTTTIRCLLGPSRPTQGGLRRLARSRSRGCCFGRRRRHARSRSPVLCLGRLRRPARSRSHVRLRSGLGELRPGPRRESAAPPR